MALTRGFSFRCFNATEVEENSLRSALQLTHEGALSGDEALHFEQVCTVILQADFALLYLIIKKREHALAVEESIRKSNLVR